MMNLALESKELQSGLNYYSIYDLEKLGIDVDDLPLSYKIIIESILRNIRTGKTSFEHIERLIQGRKQKGELNDIPFYVSRLVMHDLGLGNLIDLASLREEVVKFSIDASTVNPVIPVNIVIDHSVAVDYYGTSDAYIKNLQLEFKRNRERYEFIKWISEAFKNVKVLPPSLGIIHEINLEYLSTLVAFKKIDGVDVVLPDTLVGLDSHTPMINGLGVLGWGVGGIEGVGVMLGEPVSIRVPKVIGVKLMGEIQHGVVATDIVLAITEKLRARKVVDKFVEFFGPSVRKLSVFDRATISNMCPEYGATVGLFPVDEQSLEFLAITGKSKELIDVVEKYYKAQGMFGVREKPSNYYEEIIEINLSEIHPSFAGPNLPNKNLDINSLPSSFSEFLKSEVGHIKRESSLINEAISNDLRNGENFVEEGDVVIASITSCTNTANPKAVIAAALLAKKAVDRGLKVSKKVKTSFSPGSRTVERYLRDSGLQEYLDVLGFNITGFGCMTCEGRGGPLNPNIEKQIINKGLTTVSITSSNRNFEGRVHRNVKANYITSPSLVVALALSGNINRNLAREPIGMDKQGNPVFLVDITPTDQEIEEILHKYVTAEVFKDVYDKIGQFSLMWDSLKVNNSGQLFKWNPESTYVKPSPFFGEFKEASIKCKRSIREAQILMVLGDNVTTDHISPEGYIPKDSPAAKYLLNSGISERDLDSYGSRRGNPEVKVRGAFSNNMLKNELVGILGGYTKHFPSGDVMTIFDAASRYMKENIPLVVFAGENYGMGSSRDWAGKGTALLNIKAIIAKSFERIHRENLVYMGILPLEFMHKDHSEEKLNIDYSKPINIELPNKIDPLPTVKMTYYDNDSGIKEINLLARLDTKTEVDYYCSGGILPYILGKFVANINSTN
jgi:aconitate hydratase